MPLVLKLFFSCFLAEIYPTLRCWLNYRLCLLVGYQINTHLLITNVCCCSAAETCYLEPEVGKCKAMIERYYYDQSSKACNTFNYGGCEGNANNFETKQKCLDECTEAGKKIAGKVNIWYNVKKTQQPKG